MMDIEKMNIWSSIITSPHSVIVISGTISRQMSLISWTSNQPGFQELMVKSNFKSSTTALSEIA